MTGNHQIVVTPQWLAEHRNDNGLIVLDATAAIPGATPAEADKKRVIPGALRFDIDNDFSDKEAPFPHTLLSPEAFTLKVRALGINHDSTIVVYDDIGLFSAPRAWWMFRAMGHANVLILNGGLPAWQKAGLAGNKAHRQANQAGDFQARYDSTWFVDQNAVENTLITKAVTLIDARSADRFHGRVDEPRSGLRRGNIPGSLNLPFADVIDKGYYKSPAELEQQFHALNVDKNQPLYFSCGSGVTACIDAVAAALCGYRNVSVYDGSWCEWATAHPSSERPRDNTR